MAKDKPDFNPTFLNEATAEAGENKPAKKNEGTATAEKKKLLGVKIPVGKLKQLKVKAAVEGVTVQKLIENQIDKLLAS